MNLSLTVVLLWIAAAAVFLFGWYVGYRVCERTARYRDEMQEGQ